MTIAAYLDLETSWRRWPPPRMLLAGLAAAHGVEFKTDDDSAWDAAELTPADLAAMQRGLG